MKFKNFGLLILLLCVGKNQTMVPTKYAVLDSTSKFEQNLDAVKSYIEKVNKTVSVLKDSIEVISADVNEIKLDLEKTIILRIRQQYSFNEAFLKARLELGKNKEFEWSGNRYSTNYPDESKVPPLVLEIEIIKDNLKEKSKELDESIIRANNQIATLDNYIKKVKDDNNNNINSLTKTISDITLYWIIAILILLITLVAVFFFLKSKVSEQQDSLSSVKDTQVKLENESNQLDTKLIQILEQKLEIAQQKPTHTNEVDHSLPLKLGEEIHRMRKRLKIMEESQGTKVLNMRIESLEEKINDMGYGIVDLVGRSFDDGMELDKAQFIPDDNLKSGERIITRVIKPRITFNDEIIQHGDVIISQGD